ncbi:MAG: hypothetical protein MPK62_14680, partial [Alphaproteobacteria bacterium]|nr:hypothetical protein [Alphaproteobacteria bacterium]
YRDLKNYRRLAIWLCCEKGIPDSVVSRFFDISDTLVGKITKYETFQEGNSGYKNMKVNIDVITSDIDSYPYRQSDILETMCKKINSLLDSHLTSDFIRYYDELVFLQSLEIGVLYSVMYLCYGSMGGSYRNYMQSVFGLTIYNINSRISENTISFESLDELFNQLVPY